MAMRYENQVALLRGINLGATRRVAMPRLRELLSEAGFDDVRTYMQSGNVVLRSKLSERELSERLAELIGTAFGFAVEVIVRSHEQLAETVQRNPLGSVAADPKRYQVTFLDAEPEPKRVATLSQLANGSEQLVAIGRELYSWHPDGAARSRLWSALAAKGALGVPATARNWTTVNALLEMAGE